MQTLPGNSITRRDNAQASRTELRKGFKINTGNCKGKVRMNTPAHTPTSVQTVTKALTGLLLAVLLVAGCAPSSAAPTAVPGDAAATVAPATEVPAEAPAVTPTPVPAAEEPTVQAGTAAGECPEATTETQLVTDPAGGYCFLIPADFETMSTSPNLVILAPTSTSGHRERAVIEVAPADGDVEAQVGAVLATVTLPAGTLQQTELTVGGFPAIQLDNMPGQDINRQLFVVANGMGYRLTFMPLDPAQPEATAQMEELYALVVSSLQFTPPTAAAPVEAPAADANEVVVLDWTGEIEGACQQLVIRENTLTGDVTAAVGVCGDAPSVTAPLRNADTEWAAIHAHFGPIQAETPNGTLTFSGAGFANSDQWANALATWASFTAMELVSGRTSASARTTLAWSLGEIGGEMPGCAQLVVLAYGYAYAMIVPCEGGPASTVGEGWLTDGELATFADWAANAARVEAQAGYLDAQGQNPLTVEEVGAWSQTVYDRLASGS